MWHSLVARFVRDEEAAGSNPVIPTIENKAPPHGGAFCFTQKQYDSFTETLPSPTGKVPSEARRMGREPQKSLLARRPFRP